ncbi:aryl-alcohol oxidase precursor [Guyanagaster necrorhizus]|uniref:Aryl-alcohol oxidase n=1 Tax=Guyanagaster necrorhizus TaxID=856835 RepID=A0A9P8AL79_9AGAR|nr:aryl-alcohol oxidase precursor [Guyanagaster necrorhizus MCA 3950]KAG7439444.1 aryl-alcohol oxidase precursor [Guyanagaster necrorhizus MCA 3950]
MSLQLVLLALITSAFGLIYEKFSDLPTTDFDFIIIGGGTAGNVLANRLTEQPDISVLVIEAGASTADVLVSEVPFFCPQAVPQTPLDWNYTTIPQAGLNNRPISYPRGFGLGGSSAVNFMVYTRGSSQDYDRYAAISGDEGWSWDSLQPYIRRAERFVQPADHHNTTGQFNPEVHGFDGILSITLPGYPRGTDQRVIQTTSDLADEFPFNLDMNSGYQLGVGWMQTTVGNGTRSSSEVSYLGAKYISRPNLHVLIHTHVTRILQSGSNHSKSNGNNTPKFDLVEFTQDSGVTKQTLSPSKEIILSAGSLNTPNILLHSGIGDSDELATVGIESTVHLPDVGKNLTDHPRWVLNWLVTDTDTLENVYFRNETYQEEVLDQWLYNRTGFLSSMPTSQLGWLRVPDGTLAIDPSAGNETAHFELIFSNGIYHAPFPPTGDYFAINTVVLCPLSRGSVTINSTDPLSPPVVDPAFFSNPQDIEVMRQAVAKAQDFVKGPAWDGHIIELVTNTTDDDIRNGITSIYHPLSTASMSPRGADWGVVDPDFVLKGVEGVRIVDASVLPKPPAGHTQAAVYFFAERGADLIKKSWGIPI